MLLFTYQDYAAHELSFWWLSLMCVMFTLYRIDPFEIIMMSDQIVRRGDIVGLTWCAGI